MMNAHRVNSGVMPDPKDRHQRFLFPPAAYGGSIGVYHWRSVPDACRTGWAFLQRKFRSLSHAGRDPWDCQPEPAASGPAQSPCAG